MAIKEALEKIEDYEVNTRLFGDYSEDEDILSTRQENDPRYVYLSTLTITINQAFKNVTEEQMTEILVSSLLCTDWESVPVTHIEDVSKATDRENLDWHQFHSKFSLQKYLIAFGKDDKNPVLYWTQYFW